MSGDPQEAVREPLGMVFRKPEFGKRKYLSFSLDNPRAFFQRQKCKCTVNIRQTMKVFFSPLNHTSKVYKAHFPL